MLRSLLFAGACLMAGTAMTRPAMAQPAQQQGFHPHPMCIPVATPGQKAASPCPIPPPPRVGMPPLEEGSPCQCGDVKGKVQNGPRPD